MRLDIAGFRRTKDRLSLIHDMCSEVMWDPATSEARRDEVAAFRKWMNGHHFD